MSRSSLTMKKPQKFAEGKGITIPRSPRGADAASDESPAVEKHVVSATPASPLPKPRKPPSSSAFLQPEHFIAELQVSKSPDVRPELAYLASGHPRRRLESSKHVANSESDDGGAMTVLTTQPDLESFCEPANALPTLALSYDGKPAPAPAHLRTKASNPVVAEPVGSKNSATGESPGEPTVVVLQKSGSSGDSTFKVAGDEAQHKMRVRSLRENPGTQDPEEKPSSGLRRMLHWGAPMEFLKSLGMKSKKKRKKKATTSEFTNGKPEEELRSRRSEPESLRDREEESGSPMSSASSVSTTYSEVSSKSHSYKQLVSKKNVNPEPSNSKRRMLRNDPEDDGIFQALRQGAMFQDCGTTGGGEDDDSFGVLDTKASVTKPSVPKHKRNSTWDAGNQMGMAPADQLFSPKQPRLPSRDAHVLLAPPRRLLSGEAAATRNDKPSRVPELTLPLPSLAEATTPSLSPLPSPVEPTSPLPSPLPSPVSVAIGSQTFPTSPQLRPTSPLLSQTPNAPSISSTQGLHTTSPRPTLSPRGGELQSSLSGSQTPGTRSQRLTSPRQRDSAASPRPKSLSRSHSAIASFDVKSPTGSIPALSIASPVISSPLERASEEEAMVPSSSSPKPQVGRSPTFSFEQIVAGPGRSPPTDNTLMKFFFKCREIEGLNRFLAVQKRRFLEDSEAEREKCFHMIMSGAGGGLSSMISTICTAWLLENTMASATSRVWHPIPVMNMGQQDMWRHRDAAWLFHVCGIDAKAVLFRDEITPTNEAVISGRVKRAVMGQDVFVTKADEVSSSCTIVAEKFRQEAAKLMQARYMMTLLLAGILVDTKNLSSGSARDKQQATVLLVGAGSLGRNVFYNHLISIRDVNFVTTFIKEIYGDSNALTGEKPAQLAFETKGLGALRTNEKSPRRPVSSILPSQFHPSRPDDTWSQTPKSPDYKTSLAPRRMRSRSIAQ